MGTAINSLCEKQTTWNKSKIQNRLTKRSVRNLKLIDRAGGFIAEVNLKSKSQNCVTMLLDIGV
jgi:hypothetical protein